MNVIRIGYLRIRFVEFHGLVVPIASFEVESEDVGAIVGFMIDVLVDGLREHLEDEVEWNTVYSKVISSMGMVYFLAKFCRTPVRKDWVKKKPLSQKLLGALSLIQSWKNLSRCRRSIT
jgi:hypothetical protein